MKRNIKGYAIKLTSALFLAAAIMSVGTKVAKADEMDTQVVECVETECEMPAAPEVEGQGDIIDDQFAVAPEAEAQPATETEVEAPADNKVVLQTTNGTYEEITVLMPGQGNFYNPIKDGVIDPISFLPVEGQGDVIDDEFAVAPEAEVQPATETTVEAPAEAEEVEGQGDVIDDQFAVAPEAETQPATETTVEAPAEAEEVEGQGDVIDDEFAVAPEAEAQPATESLVLVEAPVVDVIMNEVEGQGDVIDDQFAVTPEAEAAVEVAENDTEVVAPSVNSFVAVGSAEASQNNSEEKTDNKSDVTKGLETVNDIINPLNNVYGKPICKKIDDCDVLGKDEKEMAKLFVKTGLGVADGVVLGDFIPGFGAMRKGTKMAENFSKALDAKTTTEEIGYTIEGVKNFGEAVVSAVPGGGLVVAAANVQQAIKGYCVKKVVDFVKWLF